MCIFQGLLSLMYARCSNSSHFAMIRLLFAKWINQCCSFTCVYFFTCDYFSRKSNFNLFSSSSLSLTFRPAYYVVFPTNSFQLCAIPYFISVHIFHLQLYHKLHQFSLRFSLHVCSRFSRHGFQPLLSHLSIGGVVRENSFRLYPFIWFFSPSFTLFTFNF